MTVAVLGVIAVFQLVFGLAIIVLLLAGRRRRTRRARARVATEGRLVSPVHRWLLGEGDVEAVAAAMRSLPLSTALDDAASLVTQQVPAERLRELAAAVRGDEWTRRALAGAASRLWWRRLDAARTLSVVGGPDDAPVVQRLLDDRYPAVQAVATRAIPQAATAPLVRYVVDRLPRRTYVVRVSQYRALRDVWPLAAPALLARLTPPSTASPEALAVWVGLAGALEVPACVAACVPLRTHGDARVRMAVARVLKSYFHADAEAALAELLRDADWRVRGQAARALGALRAEGAVPLLAAAMADESWWVRFRAGLSLAQVGERGRHALRDLRANSDRYGREMATLVSGLSDGAVTELAEL